MESTLLVLLGMGLGIVWARAFPHLMGGRLSPAAPVEAPAIPPVALEVKSAEIAPRAERLHKIGAKLEAVVHASSHPNELKGFDDFQAAATLMIDPAMPLAEVVDYACGCSVAMAGAALTALRQRSDGEDAAERIADKFDVMPAWHLKFALDYLAALREPMPVEAPLARCQSWWEDTPTVLHYFHDYFEAMDKRGEVHDPVSPLTDLPTEKQARIRAFLEHQRHPLPLRIAATLKQYPHLAESTHSAPGLIATFGTFWNDDLVSDPPVEVPSWERPLQDVLKTFEHAPIRSILCSGEPLAGKTSLLKIAARKLESNGWRVFEASASDLQAGQQYIGQLEARIRQVLEGASVSEKVIWYVPDVLALALSGTNQSQSSSILDQVMPAVAAGRLVIWSEGTSKSTARLLQLHPAVRRSFEVIRLEAMDTLEAKRLAQEIARRIERSFKLTLDPSYIDGSIEAAKDHLSASCLPGSALALMKLGCLRFSRPGGRRTLDKRDVLESLAQMTGLPQSILDGSERLDLAQTTGFFSRRVIGQPEAVASIVERIAMLKSGLNDPGKPFGVFLFAGPTGTGKTELTKAATEFLFGSTDRMIRLDMSEYQAHDAVAKIIGGPNMAPDADTLITRIRKQPFSLILLDELEKSNPNVWDLFLQVFDEGRLTDLNGQTADFRHCLIILTTNLGATSHQASGLGFAPGQNVYTSDQVLRAIGQTFRPEFQNRLDKIIVFRPLTREHMRGILKKELDRLFERRGLKDRSWAIEWEGSALEFLLEKGFSPDMGARPLKRAIDQYVVAPLAGAIVERRAPDGEQFVFVRSDGETIQADFVDPDGDGDAVSLDRATVARYVTEDKPTLESAISSPQVSPAEIVLLAEHAAAIALEVDSDQWSDDKSALSEAINNTGFWSRPDRFEVLARFELMDRLAVAAGTVQALNTRLSQGRLGGGAAARELVSRLALQIRLVNEGLQDLKENAPAELAVLVEPVLASESRDRRAVAEWRHEIMAMYRGWARLRNMQCRSIDLDGTQNVLLVSGFGAHRVLAREPGLHVMERPESSGAARLTVRVVVTASPPGDVARGQRKQALAKELEQAARSSLVIRRYRREPSPLVRNADGSWRSGKLDAILAGEFDIIGQAGSRPPEGATAQPAVAGS